MSKRIEAMSVPELAKEFNDATVRKWGTDEDKVFAIVKEVRLRGRSTKKEFQNTVLGDLTLSQRDRLLRKGNGNIIHGIFRDEFSEFFSKADLVKAYGLYDGSSPIRAGRWDDFIGGVGDNFDLSSTKAKLGLVAMVGLALLCPPAAAVVGGVMLLDGADRLERGLRKGDYREAGRGAGAMVGAVPGLRGVKTPKASAVSEGPMAVSRPAGKIEVIDLTATARVPSGTPLASSGGYYMAPARGAGASAAGLQTVPSVQTPVYIAATGRTAVARPRVEGMTYDQLPTVTPARTGAPRVGEPQGFPGGIPVVPVSDPAPDRDKNAIVEPGTGDRETIGDSKNSHPPISDPDPRAGEPMRFGSGIGFEEDWSDVLPDFEENFLFPSARKFGGVVRNADGTYTKRHFLGVIEAEFEALNFVAALSVENPALKDFCPVVVDRPEPDRLLIGELPGRSLGELPQDTLRAIPPRAWKDFMNKLTYLNERGLYHGDINEGNILWDGRGLRLIDFGRAEIGERKYSAEGLLDDVRRAEILRDSIKIPGFKENRFPRTEPQVLFAVPARGSFETPRNGETSSPITKSLDRGDPMTGGNRDHNRTAAYLVQEVQGRLEQEYGISIDASIIRNQVHLELGRHKENGIGRSNDNVTREKFAEVVDHVIHHFGRKQTPIAAANLESSEIAHAWLETKIQDALQGLTVPGRLVDRLRTQLRSDLIGLLQTWGVGRLEELDDVFREAVAGDFMRRVEERLEDQEFKGSR